MRTQLVLLKRAGFEELKHNVFEQIFTCQTGCRYERGGLMLEVRDADAETNPKIVAGVF